VIRGSGAIAGRAWNAVRTPARLLEWAFTSAFSYGIGYEAHPPGSRFSTEQLHGYFIDYRAKIHSPRGQADDRRALRGLQLAQRALGWWEELLAGHPRAEDEFLGMCAALEASAERSDHGLVWPCEAAMPKYGVASPWYSAMTQAQVASVFVRAHASTGDDRYGDLAARATEPILRSQPGGFVVRTPDGPVLEKIAFHSPPSEVLNSWIFALWGLWDVALALGEERALRLFEESVECLRCRLSAYDVGWWTKYGLFPHPLPDLAKPFYHRLHVTQLDVMARLTAVPDFRETSERWARYDRPPAPAAAVASKLAFVPVNLVARRRTARVARSVR
jgi:heparosan-N-sulfate-glucuronate 5-epimerase